MKLPVVTISTKSMLQQVSFTVIQLSVMCPRSISNNMAWMFSMRAVTFILKETGTSTMLWAKVGFFV